MYRLIFQPRDKARPAFTGDPESLVIGRAPQCGLRLPESGVRDQHASLERRENGYFIRDLTKSLGVRVNGAMISEQRLATGDELEIGAVRLIFEVFHEPPPDRRSFDPWQLLAILVVIALIAGQLGLYVWIFSQPHPKNVRTDIVAKRNPGKDKTVPPPAPVAAPLVPLVPSQPVPAVTPSVNPEILSGLLKVARADRTDAANSVILQIIVQSRVGDRQLDTSAVGVHVQFMSSDSQVLASQWAAIPTGWDNFTSKQLTARWSGAPAQCAGCVVRTYYRKQLQDVWGTTKALAAAAPAPSLP